MRRQLILLLTVIFASATAAYGVRHAQDQDDSPLRPEVVYFAHHLNARLQDSSYRSHGGGMSRLREEVDQMMTVFQTTNNHDDLVKEAVDVALAAMMTAHNEGRRRPRMAATSY